MNNMRMSACSVCSVWYRLHMNSHGHIVHCVVSFSGTPMQYSGGGAVIICQALPGTTGAQGQSDSWRPKSDWFVFKRGSQLYPRFVVWYN